MKTGVLTAGRVEGRGSATTPGALSMCDRKSKPVNRRPGRPHFLNYRSADVKLKCFPFSENMPKASGRDAGHRSAFVALSP